MQQTTAQYFEAFFEEKDIDFDETFEFDDANGRWNLMTYGVVIDAIKSTSGAEADNIANKLRQIDFANGDVKHFLRYMGEAMANVALVGS